MASSTDRFRNNLRVLRVQRWPLTQEQLGEAIGSYDRYMKIENGLHGATAGELRSIVALINRRGKALGLAPITADETGVVVEPRRKPGRPRKSAVEREGAREHRMATTLAHF